MRRYLGSDVAQRAAGTTDAIAAAKRGELVVLNADNTYVVVTDAFSERGVERMRAIKQRPDMNIPVFVGQIETVDGISPMLGGAGRVARELMKACWPGALTVIGVAQPSLAWTCTPNGTVAMRMPLHSWTLEVVRGIGPTATVPAHAPDAQPFTNIDDVVAALGDAVSVYLDGGPCLADQTSTVIDATAEQAVLVREGAFTAQYLQEIAPELHVD